MVLSYGLPLAACLLFTPGKTWSNWSSIPIRSQQVLRSTATFNLFLAVSKFKLCKPGRSMLHICRRKLQHRLYSHLIMNWMRKLASSLCMCCAVKQMLNRKGLLFLSIVRLQKKKVPPPPQQLCRHHRFEDHCHRGLPVAKKRCKQHLKQSCVTHNVRLQTDFQGKIIPTYVATFGGTWFFFLPFFLFS